MVQVRRHILLGLVCCVILWFGHASAQNELRTSHAADSRGVAIIQLLADREDLLATWYPAVARVLAEGLQRLAPLPADQAVPQGLCAHLVGTSGATPRLDGGGDLLSAVGGVFEHTRYFEHASNYRIQEYQHEGPSLVIVDEFSLEGLAVALQRYADVGVNARAGSFDPLWQATYGYRVGLRGTTPEATHVPHGHLVAYHALAQLPRGTRILRVRMPHDDRVDLHLWNDQFGSLNVHLVAMRFGEIDTIKDALGEVGLLGPAAVVLSWGIVACDLAVRYDQVADPAQYPTIAEFLLAALRTEAAQFERLTVDICDAFEGARPGIVGVPCEAERLDELLGLAPLVAIAGYSAEAIKELEFDPVVGQVYFAAAGNQGLSIPMPPAAWQGVVGVEACASDLVGSPASQRASFSNAASVLDGDQGERALGAWFASPMLRTDEYDQGEPPVLGYWGTSFATPTVALRSLDLTGIWGGAYDCDGHR